MIEEKKIILEMVKEGKISVDEAEKLLDKTQGGKAISDKSLFAKSTKKKFLKILIMEENKTKVNINIPIALAEVALKLVPEDKLQIKGKEIFTDEILKLIEEGSEGVLVDIETTDKEGKGVKVKVFIN